jgi:hypothetical protein
MSEDRPENSTARDSAGRWLPGKSANPDGKFKPGTSPNPGGRPKDAAAFRASARRRAWRLSKLLMQQAATGAELDPGTVQLLRFFADRGGYLPADRLLTAEATRLKILLTAMTMDGLDDAKRTALLALIGDRSGDVLGESKQLPATDSNP